MKQLNEFDTLAEAQAHTEIESVLLTSNSVIGAMVINDLYLYFRDATDGTRKALIDVIKAGSPMDFSELTEDGITNNYLLDGFISSETDVDIKARLESLKAYLIAQSDKTVYPYINATQAQFNMANGLSAVQDVEHVAGNDIVITLASDLPERVAATVWFVEDGFDDVKMGKNVYLQSAQKYRIKMSGVKSGSYQIRIPLLTAIFTAESI